MVRIGGRKDCRLAAYLLTCDIALTEEQERIRAYITADTDGMGITLGWIARF